MSYNILLDTNFKINIWKFNNCSLKDGKIISSKKVFGIEQELILPDPTKLYFRCSYFNFSKNIKDIKIGIQNEDVLNINYKNIKVYKWDSISVIAKSKCEKIKVHIIFEADEDINEVIIKEPILINLEYINKSTWLKSLLDRSIEFIPGYSYKNEYKELELSIDNQDFEKLNKEKAKIGLIIKEKNNKEIKINAKFNIGNYYLIKLDFEEINQFGTINFNYGFLNSVKEKEQIYLVFKAKEKEDLKLIINANQELEYLINLKRILLVDITKLNLLSEDIINLPYV